MTMTVSDTKIEYGKIDGDVYVRDGGDFALHGMIVGTLTVGPGGHAEVYGMVDQLVVRDSGRAVLHGTCNGNAQNLGGELVIHGTVKGSVIGPVSP